jgi:hypothetical protein
LRTVYDILGGEEQKCLVRRAAREREEEEDVVGGEKEDAAEGGAVRVIQVGGASVADVRWTREAVEAEETENPSRAKGEWPRAIGFEASMR